MGLIRVVKRYKRRLAKRFSREIRRRQLNIATDRALVTFIRLMAHQLEVPIYVLCEHSLQLGIAEVYTMTQDKALKDELCRHLVQDHLLTPVTKPESEPISRRALRLRNAMDFLRMLDDQKTPEAQRAVILRFAAEMANDQEPKKEESKND